MRSCRRNSNPIFKSDPKWDSLFKLSLTGDDEIPINKRGSGVRRLVLFSFFRAEAERLREENKKRIYHLCGRGTRDCTASRQPAKSHRSTAIYRRSRWLPGNVNYTRPALASLLPVNSIRYICAHEQNGREVCIADEDVIRRVVADLGIIPDKRAKVLVCVEGPHDLRFLRHINSLLRSEDDYYR